MSQLFYDAGPSAFEHKVMLATTAYDSPDASYTFSIARSREALSAAGISSAYLLLQGNCHVDDARNAVVRDFLESDCEELVFIDADVSWEPERLVELCGYDKDIVGGVYPFRRTGEANMPVRMLKGVTEAGPDGLMEVEALPTGFLKIKRHVIETMAQGAAKMHKQGHKPMPLLFERDTWGIGRRSGDIHFCMRWREMGGKCYAAPNMRLGHCGKQVIRDSLSAVLRRQSESTLRHVVETIRDGNDTLDTYHEIVMAKPNPWGLEADGFRAAVDLSRAAKGPILEIGSGISTILMAAANPKKKIYAIEHDAEYAAKLEKMTAEAGVGNVFLVTANIKNGWYDLSEDMGDLPKQFGFALVDGPPRVFGDRMKFFDALGKRCSTIMCDDAEDPAYSAKLAGWAEKQGRNITIDWRTAVIFKDSHNGTEHV